jgi:hypothetical protein
MPGMSPDAGMMPPSSSGSGDAGTVVGARCSSAPQHGADQFFSTSASGTASQASGWGVYDNQWSCSGGTACLDEAVYVCSSSSWYSTANLPAGNTGVLSYVSTQVNFNQVPLGNFHSLVSTFSEVSPHNATAPSGSDSFGDYEAAYDVFFGPNNDYEIMIWVDNNGQTPAGGWNPIATNVTISGRAYNVYVSGGTISWVAVDNFTSGTVDLLALFNYTTNTLHQFSATEPTGYLNQIQFGFELCSTNSQAETFYLDEFSVNAN